MIGQGPSRRRAVDTVLILASALIGSAANAPTNADKPLILEVTWKATTSGRGAAAGIFATYEVQEHYQVVSCGGDSLPSFEGVKDRGSIPCLFINRLDGHIVHAEGHGAGDDQKPEYAYTLPSNSSAGVPAPGEINQTTDGMLGITLRNDAGNPVLHADNASGEESLGCDAGWFRPQITYEQFRHMTTLDYTWDHAAVEDPTMLESCNPGNVSIHIRATGPTEEVEAILDPGQQYENWIPQAGSDEDTPGNGLLVKVALQKKGQPGQKPRMKAKSFKFELSGVSKEPGVCLNWPPKAKTKTDPDFDLKIDSVANPDLQVAEDGQSATTKADDLKESSVTVFSYDSGGWGTLKVTVVLENDQTIVAHLQGKPDRETLSIPKDENQNHIADAWERTALAKGASSSESSDDDTGVWQELAQGDGLSLYEEYRGFHVQGSFLRTDPSVPDVFVYDQDDITTANFAESGLAIHIVDHDELDADVDPSVNALWVINFNSHNANLGKQHAIWLKNQSPGPGLAGIDVGGPGPPRTSVVVKIGMDAMTKAGKDGNYMAATISHELAHAVNVWHHGDRDYTVDQVWRLESSGQWVEIWPSGKCEEGCTYEVAAHGGQESGVEDCMMRYEGSYFYEWDQGPLRWKKGGGFQRGDFYGPAQASGRRYCRSQLGTGVNAPGHAPVPIAGDAFRGGCMSQSCVNDLRTCIGPPQ